MKNKVDKSHYEFGKYVRKRRWASMRHQLDEVVKLNPDRVLEAGSTPAYGYRDQQYLFLKIRVAFASNA